MESFESYESKSDLEEDGANMEDWYHDSDTSQDLPLPNDDENPLYQEVNKLPVPLEKDHFQEGLIYAMTLEDKSHNTMLVMVINKDEESFTYRIFFVQASSQKTYH